MLFRSSQIVDLVTDGLQVGEVSFSEKAQMKYTTTEEIRSYANGMVDNWFSKNLELNGGTKHQVKNPGSRAGRGDAQLKELRNLRAKLVESKASAEDIAKVDTYISARQSEINAAKPKRHVNIEALPEELRGLLEVSA